MTASAVPPAMDGAVPASGAVSLRSRRNAGFFASGVPDWFRRAALARREMWLREAEGFVSCPVYDRERLRAGNRIEGPAIVEAPTTTVAVTRVAV